MSTGVQNLRHVGFAGRAGSAWRHESVCSVKEIAPLLEAVVGEMLDKGFPGPDVFGMRLALEEALVNAIRHGHKDDPSLRVRVRYRVSPERVAAEVTDQGPGFDPDQVPDPLAPENLERPGGRGLLLIRSYVTWLCYNDRGNSVFLCKCRSPEQSQRDH